MKTTMDTSAVSTNPSSKKSKIAIAALALAFAGTATFLTVHKVQSTKTIESQQTQLSTITAEKSELQNRFDLSLARVDSVQSVASNLQVELKEKNDAIVASKIEIRNILNKKHVTEKELKKAHQLIAGLNTQIGDLQTSITKLTEDNKVLNENNAALTLQKENLTSELTATNAVKKSLEETVDVASTLNASNISITPFNIKKNGKAVVSSSAKKVDKMVVKFDLANRIIKSGTTDLYVLVIGPDGKPVNATDNFSGTFKTRDEGDKFFTAKFPVVLETAKTKNVAFSFAPDGNFAQGDYKIEIYQNGFLIGTSVSTLKKGGLFS
jgi:hypothetical protein